MWEGMPAALLAIIMWDGMSAALVAWTAFIVHRSYRSSVGVGFVWITWVSSPDDVSQTNLFITKGFKFLSYLIMISNIVGWIMYCAQKLEMLTQLFLDRQVVSLIVLDRLEIFFRSSFVSLLPFQVIEFWNLALALVHLDTPTSPCHQQSLNMPPPRNGCAFLHQLQAQGNDYGSFINFTYILFILFTLFHLLSLLLISSLSYT